MMSRPYRGPVTVSELVLFPAIFTFLITIVRLIGELAHGPEWLFGRGAGGGGALVGISWLVPIFGIYFAVKQVQKGAGPSSPTRAFLWFPLSVVVLAGAFLVPSLLELDPKYFLLFFVVFSLLSLAVASRGWSFLFKPLLVYAFAARIPVVAVMLLAIFFDWGTHYDVAPPDFPPMNWFIKWILIGLIPQLTIWIAFTVSVGGLFGGLVGGLMTLFGGKRKPTASAS